MAETIESRPCRQCGCTTRYASSRQCVRYDIDPRHPGGAAGRTAAGKCSAKGCSVVPGRKRDGTLFYNCEHHDAKIKRLHALSANEQDISQFPVFCRGERNGLRWFSGWLPWPAWQKATRTAHTPKPGFRPLVKSAKQYQQFIVQAVIVNEFPELPWLREGSEYELHFISFNHKSDNDQHSWGLQDDFVKSRLLADDRSCANTASRRERIPKDQEQRIFIAGWETVPQKGQHNGTQE